MSVLDSHYGECVRWREQGASYEALMTRAGGCRPPSRLGARQWRLMASGEACLGYVLASIPNSESAWRVRFRFVNRRTISARPSGFSVESWCHSRHVRARILFCTPPQPNGRC